MSVESIEHESAANTPRTSPLRVPAERASWESRADRALFVLAALVVIAFCATLFVLPSLSPDEVWWLTRTIGFRDQGIPFGPLDEPLRTPVERYWAPYPIAPVLAYYLPVLLAGDGSPLPLRIVSLASTLLLFFAMYRIGRAVKGPRLGAACVLFGAVSGQTLYSGHVARPDIIGAALAYLGFALYLETSPDAPTRRATKRVFLAGALVGFGLLFHLRSIIFLPVIPALALWRHRSGVLRKADVWMFAAGLIPPAALFLAYHILPAPDAYFSSMRTLLGDSRTPPAYSGARALLGSAKRLGAYLTDYYWLGGALLLPAAWFLCTRRFREAYAPLLVVTAVMISMTLVMITSPSFLSMTGPSIAIDLFLAACAVHLVYDVAGMNRFMRFVRAPAALILVGALVYNGYVKPVRRLRPSTEERVSFVSAHVKPGDTVLAPHIYWLAARENHFIQFDVLAQLGARANTGVAETLRTLRPDIVVHDRTTEMYLSDVVSEDPWYKALQVSRREFAEVMKARATLVAKERLRNWGSVAIYRLHWETPATEGAP